MDFSEQIGKILEQLDEAEGEISSADNHARDASAEACEAKNYAEAAEEHIDSAICYIEETQTYLGQLRSDIEELEEQLQSVIGEGEEEEESPSRSDLQKDIARHKTKVLKAKARNPKATAKELATAFGIGEFLVSRILEMNEDKAA